MLALLLIALLIVLALGIWYALVLRRAPKSDGAWQGVSQVSFVAGIAAVVLTALAAIVSFTTVLEGTPLNGPLAVAAFLAIPVALVGIGSGVLGLKAAARSRAQAGLALSAAAIIAWTLMETIVS